jgi:CRP/FNR family transcriptional regulator, cyclic AMP receptor protein
MNSETGARQGGPPGAARATLDEHAQFLGKVPFFSTLDAEELRELAAVARRRSFDAHEVIFHRDDPGTTLYVIRSGRVRIFLTSSEGQEVALALFRAGDAFGELALFDGQPRSASALAIEPVEAYTIQRQDFINAVMRRPRMALQLLAMLSERIRQTDSMVESLLFLDVHGRVAKKLLELADTHGVATADGVRIEMKLTQSDLASLVGASRESVNKVMSYLLAKRYVAAEKRKITILRLAELRKRIT